MAEIELHVLNARCLNRHIDNIDKIKEEVDSWRGPWNNRTRKINW